MTLRILDLFCGAGGSAYGLHQAFPDAEILGVDIRPQRRYPFTFVLGDALEFPLTGFDFVWASPPCQAYSVLTPADRRQFHPDLIGRVRERLSATGRPYIIENVPGARRLLRDPIRICGSSFNLPIWRHRYFEAPWLPFRLLPPCAHPREAILPSGRGMRGAGRKQRHPRDPAAAVRAAMGIDWMTRDELSQAIPPAYSRYLAQWIPLGVEAAG